MRIVSLLPAATDLVVTLGLRDHLVGRTHECDWPAGALDDVPVVTSSSVDQDALTSREISDAVGGAAHRGSSLFSLDTDLLGALAPDLVLTQELCDVCAVSYAQVADAVRLLDAGVRTASLEPTTLEQVLGCLTTLGALTGTEARAADEVAALRRRLAAVAAAVTSRPRPRVAALEWLDPAWPAGHWVPEQVALAGGDDVLGTAGAHTTGIEWQAVLDAAPEVLLLLPCGFPPDRTLAERDVVTGRPGWGSLPAVRAGEVWVLDGPALFNRPGPRVVRGAEVLAQLLHGVAAGAPLQAHEAVRLERS